MNRLRQSGFALLLLNAIALVGCHGKTPTATPAPTITGLSVAHVEQRQIPNSSNIMGTVHARESAVLSAQTTGRVVNVTVHEGVAVRAGQVLLTLDTTQAHYDLERSKAAVASSEESVKVAETEAALAASTLKRYEVLRDHKAVSPQEFDEVSRKAEAARAQLDVARAQSLAVKAEASGAGTVAAYGRIVAPFAGVIAARHVDPGAMAMPGMPLLEVERAGPLQLTMSVDESLLKTMHEGMSIGVQVPALSQPSIAGRVAEIDPAGDQSTHSFIVKIDLPSVTGLRSGMFGTAAIGDATHAVLLVPAAAVVTHGSLHALWVLDANHIASLRYVTLGTSTAAGVEVLSGVSAGEVVVLSPEDRELGGSRVEVGS
ncbi:MAG: efflux RND transporter periplasmic adaptor subunit [Acidobacteria bacterium]|nr:efflux RND transporter periplasmic adaptor subunit [Acidobacteriota bacterium]